VVVVPAAGNLETCCCVGDRWANREYELPPACGVSRCFTEFFYRYDLFGVGWVMVREFYQQFFPFDKQQEHLAELQELYMLDVPTLDQSRLHEFLATC
jgi:hypothetical protein